MAKLPEVISTVQRRRGWGVAEKVAILDAAFAKGGSVAAAAGRFGVSRSLIYIWCRQDPHSVKNSQPGGSCKTPGRI